MKSLLLAMMSFAGSATAAEITSFDIAQPQGGRHALLAVPSHATPAKRPLVILLHGHGGTAKQLLGQAIGAAPLSQWLDIADRDNLVIIAPDGTQGSDNKQGWNDCRADAANNPHTDDVALIAALIDRAVSEDNVDPARVFVMGMSNGGFMTFRVGIELSDRIAAIATVGASMAAKSLCKAPTKKLSVLMINGDADPLVTYGGGDVRIGTNFRGSSLAVEDAGRSWRRLDGFADPPTETRDFPKLDINDNTHAHLRSWGSDPTRYQVELIRIEGGGHVEPSIRHRIGGLYGHFVGAQNTDFEAAEEAWRFFAPKKR